MPPRILIAAVLLLLPSLSAAVQPGLRVDDIEAVGSRIDIRGQWPDACVPRLVTWASRAQGLDVLVGGTPAACTAGAHPFALELPLDDLFSPAIPGDVIRPLRIFAERGGGTPVLVGFRLLGGHQPSAPNTGFWWPEDGADGNALSLEVQGDRVGIALLSHDANGEPEWYFGTTSLRGSVIHAELARVRGGSPFTGASVAPLAQPALGVDLAFYSSTRARLWLSRQVSDTGEIEVVSSVLQRRGFDSLPERRTWLGEWLLAGTGDLPAMLEFGGSSADAHGVLRFVDATGGYTLECRAASTDIDAPAQRCVLRDAGGELRASFEHVGLDRLDGTDADGRPVVLLRPR